jgi:hypothetical protein
MSCFFAYMASEVDVVKAVSYFGTEVQGNRAVVPRIHCNIALWVGGRRCIMEVQLHLKAIYVYARLNHIYYEVARAKHSEEVVGCLQWPTCEDQRDAELHLLSALTVFSTLSSRTSNESGSSLKFLYRTGVTRITKLKKREAMTNVFAFNAIRKRVNRIIDDSMKALRGTPANESSAFRR